MIQIQIKIEYITEQIKVGAVQEKKNSDSLLETYYRTQKLKQGEDNECCLKLRYERNAC